MTGVLQEDRTRRALVVVAHPATSSLTRSVAAAITGAFERHGMGTELADLAAEGFDPVFGPADWNAFAAEGPIPDDVRAEQRRIDRVGHLVLVYPVYWWSMPALMKGWIDRVFVSGWAFETDPEHGLVKKLRHLKVHLVALGGADAATYAKRGYAAAMKAQIDQGIFGYCGATVATSELFTADHPDLPSLPLAAAQSVATTLP